MAKRRSETGKTGKHQHGEMDYSYDYSRGRPGAKRTIIIIMVLIVAVVIVIASFAFFLLGDDDESEKEEVSLTTETPYQGGFPLDVITYDYTVHNPDKEPDIFSPMVSGLPALWNITIPTTISVEGSESKKEEFTISARPDAVNKTYTFKLEVTSANTQRTYEQDYEIVIFQAFYGIEVIAYNATHDADPGNSTNYGLIIKNLGNGDDTISLSYHKGHLPSGWTVSFEYDSIDIPLFDSRAVIVNITTSAASEKGRYDIMINATSTGGPKASVLLKTSLVKDFDNRTIKEGDHVKMNYIGYFPDGLIFDTSLEEVATNANYTRTPRTENKTDFAPLEMYVGANDPEPSDPYDSTVIGFWQSSMGMKVNETKVVRLMPEQGYDDGLWRIFVIVIVSIDN